MKKIGIIVCVCFFAFTMSAQNGVPFNGLITDEAGKGVSGVRISLVKKSDKRTRTNRKGRFGLTDVPVDDTLKLQRKKETYLIPVEGRKSLRIVWKSGLPDLQAIEDQELVDFGYGFVKRREYTGFSNGISGEELRRSGTSNLLEALKGRIPGLNISTSGAPGGDAKVIMRGTKSFYGSSTPLYIVDGVIVSDLSMVNIYDVEYVEVLKDASIYGSQGANGAILVRTRR